MKRERRDWGEGWLGEGWGGLGDGDGMGWKRGGGCQGVFYTECGVVYNVVWLGMVSTLCAVNRPDVWCLLLCCSTVP